MYTVVRELPPGRTPWARANSCADFEPGSAHCAVRARARGDLGLEAIAIASFSSRALALPSERHRPGGHCPTACRLRSWSSWRRFPWSNVPHTLRLVGQSPDGGGRARGGG